MSVSVKLSWQDQVSLSAADGGAVIAGPQARVALRPLAPELLAAMRRLEPPGEEEERLADSILEEGTVDSLARWFYHVDLFRRRGLVRRSLHAGERPLATLVPVIAGNERNSSGINPAARLGEERPSRKRSGPAGWFVLSRFAYLRREGAQMVLESPLAQARVVVDDPRALAVLGALAMPASIADLTEEVGELPRDAIEGFLSLLDEAGMLDRLGNDPPTSQTESAALEPWEFHDLLFHAKSRRGRSDGRFGGTFRFPHRPAPPALKQPGELEWYELLRPDMARLEREDAPFARVQNARRSIREFAAQPLAARELGDFLFRVGRVTASWTSEVEGPGGSVTLDFAARPFPAAGALYELDFYVAVRACDGLAPGLYYYDGRNHRLGLVRETTDEVKLLLDEAAASTGIDPRSLQVLVILAARFERMAWKYESIAYSLLLKDVGVVFQTMYLAATAMSLAPCAVGCGDSELFARAAGTNYYVETSVGEFLLGSKK